MTFILKHKDTKILARTDKWHTTPVHIKNSPRIWKATIRLPEYYQILAVINLEFYSIIVSAKLAVYLYLLPAYQPICRTAQ